MSTLTKTVEPAPELLTQFQVVRAHSERICKKLTPEDATPQVADFVSPLKWHLAHTSWFFETFVLLELSDYKVFDSAFAVLFNSYYVSAGKRHPRHERGLITRPSLDQVYAYRAHVDEAIHRLYDQLSDHALGVLEIGLNHEQQHQELMLTDLKFLLWHNPALPCYDASLIELSTEESGTGFTKVQEGLYTIGSTGKTFHYDNETPAHPVFLQDFHLSNALVTNEQVATFIQEGGYSTPLLWQDEGFAWVQQQRLQRPLYWLSDKLETHFTLGGVAELSPKAAACHLSWYEAQAMAEFFDMRLPTEFEWEAASGHFTSSTRWQWTASSYSPYPGFEAAKGALGEYNGKFMINQMVLRGASVATPQDHSRSSYRNFFHPHAQWQYSGVRLAKKQRTLC